MKYLRLLPCLLVFCLGMVSCGGETKIPDAPDTDLQANITIADLISLYNGKTYVPVDTALYIEGVVSGNDIGGSLYKKIFLQDETAGIDIEINMTNNHHKYPVGQRLVIELKGLAYGTYSGQPQIGGRGKGSTERLYESECDEHFYRKGYASRANAPEPTVVTVGGASRSKYIGMLLRIDDVHFLNAGNVFADVTATLSGNAQDNTIADENGNSLVVRVSQYAMFAMDTIPSGTGSIVGIMGTYNGTPQLFLRDADDIIFENYTPNN